MSESVPIWLTALGTLLLGLIAIFQDRIRSWLSRPILRVAIDVSPPDCHKTFLNITLVTGTQLKLDCYYLRVRVINEGNARAKQVELYASGLEKHEVGNTYRRINSFIPMNLKWSNVGGCFLEAISPKTSRHCDLCFIVKPELNLRFIEKEDAIRLGIPLDKTLLNMELISKPNTMSHIIPPGEYKLHLTVAAANCLPVTATLKISLSGTWFEEQDRMFKEGITIIPI